MSHAFDVLNEHIFAGRQPWMTDAACKGLDANIFYPEAGTPGGTGPQRAMCDGCPVQAECLTYGLDEQYGMWGGKAVAPRRKIRAERKQDGTYQPPQRTIAHGTPGGYTAHLRHNVTPCRACLEAQNAYSVQWYSETHDAA